MSDRARKPRNMERVERRSGLRAKARDPRHEARAQIEVPVRFRWGDAVVDAIARNMSVGGMFIETERPAPFGVTISIEMHLPGVPEVVKIASTVRWTSIVGMGVQFGAMGARETHGLLKLLEVEST